MELREGEEEAGDVDAGLGEEVEGGEEGEEGPSEGGMEGGHA